MNSMTLGIDKYTVTIYGSEPANTLVLLHEDHGEGEAVWNLLSDEAKSAASLACISGFTWEHELSPWAAPAAFKNAAPFTGGADAYMEMMISRIIPEIQHTTGQGYEEMYLAGYSLAGLFAAYATVKTGAFDGFVSASGSMWFPDFLDFVKTHPRQEKIQRAYLSIGDKEAKTKNPIMQCAEVNTRELEHLLHTQGVKTLFELNKGGHFVDDDKRLAKGIEWILTDGKTSE